VKDEGVALVVGGGLVERRVHEEALVVAHVLHHRIHGRTLGMNVEDVHEDADLHGLRVAAIRIRRFAHHDDAAVGGAEHEARALRDLARGIAKELQDEDRDEPEGRRPPPEEVRDDRRDDRRERKERPTFPRDDRVRPGRHQLRLVSTSLFLRIHGIIARSFSPTFSMSCSARSRRLALSVGAPARFSRMNERAYSPFWMRARHSFIAWREASPITFGPVSYSPNSALFEIE